MSSNSTYPSLIQAEATPFPKRTDVKLAAGVKVEVGDIVVVVAGFGALPAAANAATGKCAGVARTAGDNTAGADGDVTITCEDGVRDFANNGVHACAQADVMATVYASDKKTISKNSADGPPVGELVAFNPATSPPSCPCRVRFSV